MDTKKICEVVRWINEHPKHACFDEASPAGIWFEFLRSPNQIIDYEHTDDHEMSGPQVSGGCCYKFTMGMYQSTVCGRACASGSDRCAFHDHVIFSPELRRHMNLLHADINHTYKEIFDE